MGSATEGGQAEPRIDVLVVAHDVGGMGGMEGVLGEVLARAPQRFRIHVVSATLDPGLAEHVIWHRVRVPRRPFPLRFLAFAALAPLRMRAISSDLCHVTGAIVPTRADLASVHFCHRAVAARTGRLVPEGVPWARRVNALAVRLLSVGFERWCYRPGRVRVLAAVSAPAAADLRRHFPGVAVTVTPNGVDASRFGPDAAARAKVRHDLGAGEGDLVVLFIGGDWWRKGLWPLVDAVGRAAREGASVKLWVAGRGPRRRLAQAVATAGASDRTRMLGPRSDVPALMAASDLLAIPSEYETTPLVVLEAAAAGLPVVTTPVGEVDDLIGATGAGLVVPPEDLVTGLADALERLAADRSLLRSMGGRARDVARSRDWGTVTGATYALWDRLVAQQSAGRRAVPGRED